MSPTESAGSASEVTRPVWGRTDPCAITGPIGAGAAGSGTGAAGTAGSASASAGLASAAVADGSATLSEGVPEGGLVGISADSPPAGAAVPAALSRTNPAGRGRGPVERQVTAGEVG